VLPCDIAPSQGAAPNIQFMPLAPIPSGEQILFNDWSLPDKLKSMKTDGSRVVEIFQAYRVWSLGVSPLDDVLAFAAGDPEQEANYGVTIGDAIQHTWIYRFSDQSVSLLSGGNINDECHTFAPVGCALFVCRRYDFTPEGMNKGYRIATINLPSAEVNFLTPEVMAEYALNPQVTPDAALYYTRITVMGSQHSSIQRMTLPAGTPELVRDNAHGAVLTPDATRYLYADSTQMSALYIADIAGGNDQLVVNRPGTSARFSPDGSRIAYLLWDDSAACSHVEIAAVDGSMAETPLRIRDCAASGEFITELAWITRP